MVTQSKLVAFIIGAGSHIGAAAAAQLRANGYKVALGSRSAEPEQRPDHNIGDPYLRVKIDVSRPETIDSAFDDVVAKLGPINVVIYNAASATFPPIQGDILSLSVNDYYDSISIGLGVFAAAKKALASGFRDSLHRTDPKTFIMTGNLLPFTQYTSPTFFTLGLQKAVAARFIATAATTYGLAENIQFYFATLVSSKGTNPSPEEFEQSASAHARVFMELIKSEKQGQWDHRFTVDSKTFPHLPSQ